MLTVVGHLQLLSINYIFQSCFLYALLRTRLLTLHFYADYLTIIGTRPGGLNYWSPLTVAYPNLGRSMHNDLVRVYTIYVGTGEPKM